MTHHKGAEARKPRGRDSVIAEVSILRSAPARRFLSSLRAMTTMMMRGAHLIQVLRLIFGIGLLLLATISSAVVPLTTQWSPNKGTAQEAWFPSKAAAGHWAGGRGGGHKR